MRRRRGIVGGDQSSSLNLAGDQSSPLNLAVVDAVSSLKASRSVAKIGISRPGAAMVTSRGDSASPAWASRSLARGSHGGTKTIASQLEYADGTPAAVPVVVGAAASLFAAVVPPAVPARVRVGAGLSAGNSNALVVMQSPQNGGARGAKGGAVSVRVRTHVVGSMSVGTSGALAAGKTIVAGRCRPPPR